LDEVESKAEAMVLIVWSSILVVRKPEKVSMGEEKDKNDERDFRPGSDIGGRERRVDKKPKVGAGRRTKDEII